MSDSNNHPLTLEEALQELKNLVAPSDPPEILKAQVYIAYDQNDTATKILKNHAGALEKANVNLNELTAAISASGKDNTQKEDLIQKVVPMQKILGLGTFCTLPNGTQGCLRFKAGAWTCVPC
jgi:hypothetical protein